MSIAFPVLTEIAAPAPMSGYQTAPAVNCRRAARGSPTLTLAAQLVSKGITLAAAVAKSVRQEHIPKAAKQRRVPIATRCGSAAIWPANRIHVLPVQLTELVINADLTVQRQDIQW